MGSLPPTGPPDVAVEFGHDAGALRQARRALLEIVGEPDDPIADAVMLTVSELVTNAVLHTPQGGTMRAWDPKPDVPLRLEVEDHEVALPERRDADEGRPGGRGLRVVDEVTDDWGVDLTPTGKIVWAEFDRTNQE